MAWSKEQESESAQQTGEGPSRLVAGERESRLGSSLVVHGTLAGDEDLLVAGRLEGEISLRQNRVTIGEGGGVKADIYAKSICVAGEVNGNLFGEDEVIIRKSGKVRGNATAPRVTLENGAKFKGSIDMQPGSEKKRTEASGPSASGPSASGPSAGGQPPSSGQVKRAGGAG